MKGTRRTHAAAFKAKVALAAIKGDKTLAELSSKHEAHPTRITEWKQQLQQHAAEIFGGAKTKSPEPDIKSRHPRHPVYPYLLRDLTITRPNHV